jgi:hypothetical protein
VYSQYTALLIKADLEDLLPHSRPHHSLGADQLERTS